MNVNPLIIGSQLFFARSGATIDGNVVSATSKPDTTPTTNWTNIGRVLSATPQPKLEEEAIIAPSPGAYRRADILTKTVALDLEFQLTDVSELFFEMLLLANGGTTGITADYQPLSGLGEIRGWFKCQQYDQSNTLRNVFDVWARAKVNAQKMDNNIIKSTMVVNVFDNALNTGTLTLG